jgi:nitrite reductase/ring-hydroxylating ferredoxin subunit
MSRQDQINLLKRLLHYVETRTTAMADSPWRNEVSAYTDAERLAEEQRVLFRKHPLVMGFGFGLARAGQLQPPTTMPVLPVLIVRGRDSRLRAFLNVCRHRGAKVAQGCGKARLFSCPYHAWTYDLAGELMGIPDERSFPDVRGERASLVELPLCEKHGLVWVIPTADGSTNFDIDPWLGGLADELASFGFASWSFYDRRLIPGDHELEDRRRYVQRGLPRRFPAPRFPARHPAWQRDRFRGVRPQPPPDVSAPEARAAQGRA